MMDQVCRDRAPVVITRDRDQAVVMMSLDDYEELEETAHLLRSPTNARRLLAAIQSLESGKGGVQDAGEAPALTRGARVLPMRFA